MGMERGRMYLRTTTSKSPGEVVVRASNDAVVDSNRTIITVEALHDWLRGYASHRTVSLQHDLALRGMPHKPQVGVGVSWDFTPQLVIRVKLIDELAKDLLSAGKIRGASLEFVPVPGGVVPMRGDDGSYVYSIRSVSSDPETTGLALVDIPAVPGADVISVRTALPNWAFAVIDPAVLNGEVLDQKQIDELRWFPHHQLENPRRRDPDMQAVIAALQAAQTGEFVVPDGASLTKGEIARRAIEHLERHVRAVEMRANGSPTARRRAKVRRVVIRL